VTKPYSFPLDVCITLEQEDTKSNPYLLTSNCRLIELYCCNCLLLPWQVIVNQQMLAELQAVCLNARMCACVYVCVHADTINE